MRRAAIGIAGAVMGLVLVHSAAAQGPGAVPGTGQPSPQAPPQQQPSDPAAQSPALPAISTECQTPGVRISGDAQLPAVTAALRERKTIRIIAIGASSKGGKYGADGGYQAIIETVLERTIPGVDVQMMDRGISGELARAAADRLKAYVALDKPDLVLWQLGTHDALMHVPVEEFKATVAAALDWLRKSDVDVVMVGLHYLRQLVPDKHYQAIRTALRAVAEEKKVLWIGRYEAMQAIEQAKRTGKGPSPNVFTMTENGYSCLSEYVVRALTIGAFARPQRQLPQRK